MTYQDTINWMFSQLPMYQHQGKSAFKEDISNTLKFSEYLKFPETKFKSLHVAGTNGKGSTSHMLASVLQESGYKVGLYTSPHLKDFRERIKVNGKEISKQSVISFIKQNKSFLDRHSLSFFEMTVGMAFDYFKKQKVDLAIVEVGLGGRLDSTNIITPEVSVITNIGFDHTQFLGNTLEAIAVEKAGIIKENIPIVIGETQKETKPIFLKVAKERNAKIIFSDTSINEEFECDLKGSYQTKNITTTLQTIKELQLKGFRITNKNIKSGLINVINNTGLKGRWQVLQTKPKVICDTAHNKEGLTYVMRQLLKEEFKNLHIVFGAVNDKDLSTIIKLLPKKAMYYFCKPNIPRGLDVKDLKLFFLENGYTGEGYASVNEAYNEALKNAKESDLVFVGGSTFVVAEII